MTYEKRLELARKFNKRLKAGLEVNKINIGKMIDSEELTAEDLTDLIGIYDKYEIGEEYEKGDKFHHDGILYEVVQGHVSQADWVPSATPALYNRITPGNVISPWKQPQGAHDAYKKGSVVTHKGKTWISTADNNTWEPSVYGWVEK